MNDTKDCDKKQFKEPVSWLMGRELLAGLKWIAAYTFMGNKLDSKDWMVADIITPPRNNNSATEPYWFDYIADTGDGMKSVYNIAYLCMSDLWVDTDPSPGQEAVSLNPDANFKQKLPRGEFLFIGGDTAYHIADTASIKERFQVPFNCAAIDLMSSGKTVEHRPLYGIPANHDYYDALDGFNRQFCKPITDDTHNPLLNHHKDPQLGLVGFQRTQTASYVALRLPHGWTFWGMDTQDGLMDKRQFAFFVSTFQDDLIKQGNLFNKEKKAEVTQQLQDNIPEKLIVATPEPSTVFGKLATHNGKDEMVKTFDRLGLETSFLADGKLNPKKCRLDISGDIHHYERYWGSTQNEKNPVNYASVVAGGGGAFLHPSHTDVDEVKKLALYPSRKDSHGLITKAILNPNTIRKGGFIWLTGGFIAFLSYYAITIPKSTWSLFRLWPENLRLALASQKDSLLAKIMAALDPTETMQKYGCCSGTYVLDLIYIIAVVAAGGYLVRWLQKEHNELEKLENATHKEEWLLSLEKHLIMPIAVSALPLFLLIQWPRPELPHPFLAGALIDLFVISAFLLFTLSRIYSDILIDYARTDKEPRFASVPLWIFNVLGIIYLVFGFLRYGTYSSSVMTFDLLMIVVWSLSTIGLIALAAFSGAHLLPNSGKIKFAGIGFWHAFLQIAVPVSLILYCDWQTILIITVVALTITFVTGQIFSRDIFNENKAEFSLQDQNKIGKYLLALWVIVGLGVFLAASWGEPKAVDYTRLGMAFVLGSIFSCIWFGWYIAVSLAFHGHNNEAGGGARSEQYRHMIRFKLTENTLTGYVIGIDDPMTEISATSPPKFRLVDIFTIQAPKTRKS